MFGTIIVTIFVALFSRLWFLQVLEASEFRQLAKQNRTRLVESEPPRGLILDRNGKMLVRNRRSLSVTVDRQIVDTHKKTRKVLHRLSAQLDIPVKELKDNLQDEAVSPYKPVAVAFDVREKDTFYIRENREDFPGVAVELLPVRTYPRGEMAAQILGYVGEISEDLLKSEHYGSRRYRAGDIVGRDGIEFTYDRFVRGRPSLERVVVNSAGDVVGSDSRREERPGDDLYLTLDARIQKVTEKALASGIEAARAAYQAPSGGAVVMDPDNGEIIAMASYPNLQPLHPCRRLQSEGRPQAGCGHPKRQLRRPPVEPARAGRFSTRLDLQGRDCRSCDVVRSGDARRRSWGARRQLSFLPMEDPAA